MIRIAAVDDEVHVLERFERLAKKFSEIEICGLFETGKQLLSFIKENPIDVVFLDIEMPEVNGLELSSQILNLNEEINIVFVTAFNQYAVEAFEINALDYILKPLTEERLEVTIQRLLKQCKTIKRNEKPFVQCIGDFEVFLGQEVLRWKNSKAKEIMAFLIQKSGIPVSWEKIADVVWPEYNTEKAQTNFHATTYLLRKRLAEAGISHILENGRGNYKILMDQVNCDLYQLEALIKNNNLKRKEDIVLIEDLLKHGYMETSGYIWAQSKAANLEEKCLELLSQIKINS